MNAWEFVDSEDDMNVIKSTWKFKLKRYLYLLIKKFKARFCARCDMKLVKQFPAVNIINMFWGKRYNNQERPNISHGKVLATCVDILGAQPNTICSINEMLCMYVNRD